MLVFLELPAAVAQGFAMMCFVAGHAL